MIDLRFPSSLCSQPGPTKTALTIFQRKAATLSGMGDHSDLGHINAAVDFAAACLRLNQWRGQMVENFARSEQAVTETLAVLSASGPPVRGAKFPHLVGQRYQRLHVLLSATEAPSGHFKAALAALETFRPQDSLRTMLCHGVTKAAVDGAGAWVAILTLTSFKANEITTDRLTLLEAEGDRLFAELLERRRKLCTALGQVRREVGARPSPSGT